MSATTALTGHGGWPMTCLLTPDGDPFFAGTYLPKPQFLPLLAKAGEAWADPARPGARRRASTVGRAAARAHRPARARRPSTPTSATPRCAGCAPRTTMASGGFGGAPKFPPSMVLEFLLRHHARTGSADALAMAARHLRGDGPRRACTTSSAAASPGTPSTRNWVVPHFEKMLYDNALLLRVYAHLWRATGDALARRVAVETADFLLRDLRTDEGASRPRWTPTRSSTATRTRA